MTSPEETFARVRELINGPKTHLNWESVRAELATSAARSKPFRERYDEAVHAALDAQWPDLLRTVSYSDPKTHRRWARTFRLSFFGSAQQSFGANLGKKYTTAITKKLIAEMTPHWLPDPHERYSGLILEHLDKLHAHLLTTLLDTGKFDGLEAVILESVGLHSWKIGERADDNPMYEMVDLLIDRCKDTLTTFGATPSGSKDRRFEHVWGPIVARSAELGKLRWLHSDNGGLSFDYTDPLRAILSDPNFDDLDTLTFSSGLEETRADLLVAREASLNLRRIGVGYLSLFSPETDPRRLIDAPNLANVTVWDVRQETRSHVSEWDSQEARRWADYKGGVQRDELAFAHANLRDHDDAQRHDALFDEHGALRRSEDLRVLVAGTLTMADAMEVVRGAAAAWPNLESIDIDTPFLDWESFVSEVTSSGLLERVRHLGLKCTPDEPSQIIGEHKEGSKAQRTAIAAQFTRVLTGYDHPFFAYKHWEAIEYATDLKKGAVATMRALELDINTAWPRWRIMNACNAHVVEQLGGREAVLDDEPSVTDDGRIRFREDW